jgi:hypothetical protein
MTASTRIHRRACGIETRTRLDGPSQPGAFGAAAARRALRPGLRLLGTALLAAAALTLAEPPRAAATTYSTISLGVSGHGYVSNDKQPWVPYKFRCFAPHPWLGPEPTCTSYIAKKGTLEFRAEPAPGWYFSHWEGDCTSSWEPCKAQIGYVGDTVYVKAVFKKLIFVLLPITIGS